jgi:GTPase SAR1 family protein
VWDTPGQEEYAEMAFPFYSNCKIFVVVVDRMKRESLGAIMGWLKSSYLFYIERD